MLKVQILDNFGHCDGVDHIPVGEAIDAKISLYRC